MTDPMTPTRPSDPAPPDFVGVLADAMATREWKWLGWADEPTAPEDRREAAFRNAANGLLSALVDRGYRIDFAASSLPAPSVKESEIAS